MGGFNNVGVAGEIASWSSTGDGSQIMSRRWDPVNNRVYMKVKASSVSCSLVAQRLCYFEATSSVGIVTQLEATAAMYKIAGVTMAANGTSAYYGYVCRAGVVSCNMVASAAITVGDLLSPSTVASASGGLIPFNINVPDFTTQLGPIAIAMTAVGASASGTGLVLLLLDDVTY